MFFVEDIFDDGETAFFPLSIIRTYSGFIHKRRTSGPAGKGWLLTTLTTDIIKSYCE